MKHLLFMKKTTFILALCLSASNLLVKGADAIPSQTEITICEGETVTLPQISGQTLIWKDENGNTYSGSQEFQPEETTTLSALAYNSLSNQIVNGDFETLLTIDDLASFSDYTTLPVSYMMVSSVPEGVIIWGQNAENHNMGWWNDLKDHTSSQGHYLIYEGATIENQVVYQTSVDVIAGESYVFSGWFANLHRYYHNPFELEVIINGDSIDTFYGKGIPFRKAGDDYGTNMDFSSIEGWHKHFTTYTATETGTVTLQLINRTLDYAGNDFGIDDLVFTSVEQTKEVLINVHKRPIVTLPDEEVCQREVIMLTPEVQEGDAPIAIYSWEDDANILTEELFDDYSRETIGLHQGNFSVHFKVTDENNCTSLNEVTTILVNETPVLLLEDVVIDQGGELQLSPKIASNTDIVHYLWSDPDGILDNVNTKNPTVNTEIPMESTLSLSVLNSYMCASTATQNISIIGLSTGVDETSEVMYLSIAPNPSNGFIELSTSITTGKLEVINVGGELVYSQLLPIKYLDLSFLNEGFYFVRVITSEGEVVEKIQLKK